MIKKLGRCTECKQMCIAIANEWLPTCDLAMWKVLATWEEDDDGGRED